MAALATHFRKHFVLRLLGIGVTLLSSVTIAAEIETDSQALPADSELAAAAEAASPLDSLAWVVGDWTGGGGDDPIHVACRWTANRQFITRRFAAGDDAGRLLLEGTQVIGWDPVGGNVRSWTFDSEGGFGEAIWTQDGDRWLIKARFTLATGEQASALNVLTRIDDNTATWSSTSREIAGRIQPNQPEVTVVRVRDNDPDQQESVE